MLIIIPTPFRKALQTPIARSDDVGKQNVFRWLGRGLALQSRLQNAPFV